MTLQTDFNCGCWFGSLAACSNTTSSPLQLYLINIWIWTWYATSGPDVTLGHIWGLQILELLTLNPGDWAGLWWSEKCWLSGPITQMLIKPSSLTCCCLTSQPMKCVLSTIKGLTCEFHLKQINWMIFITQVLWHLGTQPSAKRVDFLLHWMIKWEIPWENSSEQKWWKSRHST